MKRRNGAAARTSVVGSCGGLRADGACLHLDMRAHDFGLQGLRSLFAHDEPVFAKHCSNTSWRHACPLLVEHVQSRDELRVRHVRRFVFPDGTAVDVGRCDITLPGFRRAGVAVAVLWLCCQLDRIRCGFYVENDIFFAKNDFSPPNIL